MGLGLEPVLPATALHFNSVALCLLYVSPRGNFYQPPRSRSRRVSDLKSPH